MLESATPRTSWRSRAAGAGQWRISLGAVVAALAVAGALAASAAASQGTVRVVSKTKSGVEHLPTIQAAVNAAQPSDWVLIEPGKYDEAVLVQTPGLHIRGLDRNNVIIDGNSEGSSKGRNGIEVFKTNDVSIENLTVRNFDRASRDGGNGNEIWWNGGDGTGVIGAEGWHGAYLTAYDTGLLGGYGLFVSNSIKGSMENVYASGFNDSGLYIGACRDCQATVSGATVENSSLGYSGTNAGGRLIIENSVFRHNTAGLVPNSLAGDDEPPPQDGACSSAENTSETPKIESTRIKRCTIFRNNLLTENNNLTTPGNSTTAESPWGLGVELAGTYGDLLEKNTITNNANNGVLGFEFPNGTPQTFFQLVRQRAREKQVRRQRRGGRGVRRRRHARGRVVPHTRNGGIGEQLPRGQQLHERYVPREHRRRMGMQEQDDAQPGRRPVPLHPRTERAVAGPHAGRPACTSVTADDAKAVQRSPEEPAVQAVMRWAAR